MAIINDSLNGSSLRDVTFFRRGSRVPRDVDARRHRQRQDGIKKRLESVRAIDEILLPPGISSQLPPMAALSQQICNSAIRYNTSHHVTGSA